MAECGLSDIVFPANFFSSGSKVVLKIEGSYSNSSLVGVLPAVTYGVMNFAWEAPQVTFLNGQTARVYKSIEMIANGTDPNRCEERFGGKYSAVE